MKHLIETADSSSLATVPYDRIVLDTTTNEIVCKGGGYEYVDLGLPSGLKWAKCNVGAETETAYGDYFMWGSTTPNTASECTWTNAPFNNGSSEFDEAYFNSIKNTVCPNGILAKEYDATTQIMGGEWRMPTQPELKELLDNTTNEWVEDFNGSGVNGRKFTSKTNGNSIFIPASGYRSGSSFNNQGEISNIWSSSLITSELYNAWVLSSTSRYVYADSDGFCKDGLCVRGVFK